MKNLKIKLLALLILPLGFVACDDSDGSGSAKVQVSMIDAPADYDAVIIDVLDVQVNAKEDSGSGWQSLAGFEPGEYDLLQLRNGNSEYLGVATLPAGKLSQVRLVLGDNNRLIIDSVTFDLKVPSGSTSGLKILVNENVEAGVTYSLVIDFDAAKSIVEKGNGTFSLKPVIRASLDDSKGAIRGVVLPKNVPSVVYAITGTDTFGSYPNSDGDFLIGALQPGSYNISVEPSTASGFNNYTQNSVSVVVGETTVLDTIRLN